MALSALSVVQWGIIMHQREKMLRDGQLVNPPEFMPTVKEIKAKLDKKGISYPSKARKAELEKLYKKSGVMHRIAKDPFFNNGTLLIIFLNSLWIGSD